MAGPPPGFAGMLATKYQIEQQRADDAGAVQQAQAQNITQSTPFENALRAAQADQTKATAQSIMPLANASIAKTAADTAEAGARSGLYGAQTQDIRSNDLANIGPLGAQALAASYKRLGYQFSNPPVTAAPAPVTGYAAGTDNVPDGQPSNGTRVNDVSTTQGAANANQDFGQAINNARGTTGVQPGSGFGGPTTNGFGSGHPLEGFLTHLFGAGAPPINPATGQSSIAVNPASMGPASADGRIGFATPPPGYAKGTSRVPGKGHSSGGSRAPAPAMPAPATAAPPPGMVPGGAPSPAGGPTPMAAPPQGGLASMLMAAMGANRVPGQGTGKVDTVPAMLAPGEAVLNRHAAETIGRARIAAANAKGAKVMGLHKGVPTAPPRATPHFASGTDNVPIPTGPAPGQTITNGSWDPSTLAPPTSLPTLGQNTSLRLQLGMGKPRV